MAASTTGWLSRREMMRGSVSPSGWIARESEKIAVHHLLIPMQLDNAASLRRGYRIENSTMPP